jgi:hypothetical protein
MATSGRGSGVVGYNVQIAVEANHHLIVMHEVTNDGTDRSQLSHVANETKTALGVEKLDAVADRGYFNSEARMVSSRRDAQSSVRRALDQRFGKESRTRVRAVPSGVGCLPGERP